MSDIDSNNNDNNSANISFLEALKFVNERQQEGIILDNTQRAIFLKVWQNSQSRCKFGYKQIAESLNMTESGVKKSSARLYAILNELLNPPVKIGKQNIIAVLSQMIEEESQNRSERQFNREFTSPRSSNVNLENNLNTIPSHKEIKLEPPDRPVPLNSQFYIARRKETVGYQTIEEPGAVIRIIGARKSGASSLVSRLSERAKSNGDRSVLINFLAVESEILKSKKLFMRWFCVELSNQLQIEERLNDYWGDNEKIVNSYSQAYLEQYLLRKLSFSIIIILERIDVLFDQSSSNPEMLETARNFFSLIRSWIERQSEYELWEKIKYILVQRKQEIDMGIRRSPFNIGEEINLNNFSSPEIIDLAKRHQLSWSEENEIKELTNIFGDNIGNPYLIRNILYRLVKDNLTIKEFIQLDLKSIAPFERYLLLD